MATRSQRAHSLDGNFGVCCESQLQIGLAVRIDADAQQAGQVDALGSTGASSQDACQSAVLVARAAVLQDAHRMGSGSSWHIGWARAAVTVRGADAAASTFYFSLNLVALARRFLVVALAWCWWAWWRRRRRRRRRWPTAGHHRVGGLGLDATLTWAWLATLKLHEALLAPSGSPAVLHLTSKKLHQFQLKEKATTLIDTTDSMKKDIQVHTGSCKFVLCVNKIALNQKLYDSNHGEYTHIPSYTQLLCKKLWGNRMPAFQSLCFHEDPTSQ